MGTVFNIFFIFLEYGNIPEFVISSKSASESAQKFEQAYYILQNIVHLHW